jgi:transcription antitermination protein NusB
MSDFPNFDPESDEVINRELIEHEAPSTDRSLARRVALQALYEIDSAEHPIGDVLSHHVNLNSNRYHVKGYITRLVKGVVKHFTALDEVLQTYAPDWPIQQVSVVDRNILRIALYELAVDRRTPIGVAIDEAIELAKLFGADNTPRFINGVLGAIADDLEEVRAIFKPPEQKDTPASSE